MFGDIGNSYIGMMVNYGFILNGFTVNGKEPIMPWKESTTMSQQREFVHLARSDSDEAIANSLIYIKRDCFAQTGVRLDASPAMTVI